MGSRISNSYNTQTSTVASSASAIGDIRHLFCRVVCGACKPTKICMACTFIFSMVQSKLMYNEGQYGGSRHRNMYNVGGVNPDT